VTETKRLQRGGRSRGWILFLGGGFLGLVGGFLFGGTMAWDWAQEDAFITAYDPLYEAEMMDCLHEIQQALPEDHPGQPRLTRRHKLLR